MTSCMFETSRWYRNRRIDVENLVGVRKPPNEPIAATSDEKYLIEEKKRFWGGRDQGIGLADWCERRGVRRSLI